MVACEIVKWSHRVIFRCIILRMYFYFLFFGHVACVILVPQSRFDPVPPAVEVQSLNH